jgi:hypothetical protein
MQVDLAVKVAAEWKPGSYRSEFDRSTSTASQSSLGSTTAVQDSGTLSNFSDTHPVLELATDILMHLAHEEACRERMHQLHLEDVLVRLLKSEDQGFVRQRALNVLWAIRDQHSMASYGKGIQASIDSIRQVRRSPRDRCALLLSSRSGTHCEMRPLDRYAGCTMGARLRIKGCGPSPFSLHLRIGWVRI